MTPDQAIIAVAILAIVLLAAIVWLSGKGRPATGPCHNNCQ